MRCIFLFLSIICRATYEWPQQNDAQPAFLSAHSCWPHAPTLHQFQSCTLSFALSLRGGGETALLSEPNLHSTENPLLRKVFADGLAKASHAQAKLEATQSALRRDAAQVRPPAR